MARTKGARGKATLEREEIARREKATRDLKTMPNGEIRKLAKERLEELMNVALGNATYYQNGGVDFVRQEDGSVKRVNRNPNFDKEEYRWWFKAAHECMADLTQYQSPKLSAVAVGQVTKMVIEVVNGLPPRDTRSTPPSKQIEGTPEP